MVYIYLFHGRDTITEELDDWGSEGPTIGPFKYVQITYMSDIKFAMEREAFKEAFPEVFAEWTSNGYANAKGTYDPKTDKTWIEYYIQPEEDCIPWKGKFYGDFSIIAEPPKPAALQAAESVKVSEQTPPTAQPPYSHLRYQLETVTTYAVKTVIEVSIDPETARLDRGIFTSEISSARIIMDSASTAEQDTICFAVLKRLCDAGEYLDYRDISTDTREDYENLLAATIDADAFLTLLQRF